jgi:hypothetical protein
MSWAVLCVSIGGDETGPLKRSGGTAPTGSENRAKAQEDTQELGRATRLCNRRWNGRHQLNKDPASTDAPSVGESANAETQTGGEVAVSQA